VPPDADAIEARSMVSPAAKPLIVAVGIAEPRISTVPLPANAIPPLVTAPDSRIKVPPLMVSLAIVPPEETTSEPANTVSPLATPPDSTCSVPPLTRAPTSLPPALTTSTPPALTMVPLAVPDTYCVPPLCTAVPLATPPPLMICSRCCRPSCRTPFHPGRSVRRC